MKNGEISLKKLLLHRKNSFAEVLENLARCRSKNNALLNAQADC